TATDKPARNELRIRVQCNPRPAITRSRCLLIEVAILFLRVNKRPNLVALNAPALKIHKNLVLIFRASAAKIAEKLHNRGSMHVGHAGYSPEGIALDQRGNHSFSFLNAQLIHADNMLRRLSIVNTQNEILIDIWKRVEFDI